MLRWLYPPQIDDEFNRVGYYSLHYTLQLLFVLGLLSLILPPTTPLDSTLGPMILGLILGCYVLLRQRKLQLAGGIFLSVFWLFMTIMVYSLNGIHNASVFIYVIVIIFANVIFTRRWAVLSFALLSILSITILTIGEIYGFLPLYSTGPILIDRFSIGVLVFGATGILSSLALGSLRKNLDRLRQKEMDLQAHNQELEMVTRNLVASEARYRLLFDHTVLMAAVYDSDGQIILVNDATIKAFGLPRAALEGHNISEVFPAESTQRLAQMNQQALASGKPITFEGNSTLSNGESIYYLRHTIPLPSSGDSTDKPQVLVLTNDLTERKRHLEHLQALQIAQEKLTFFTDFFNTVSHDIKTPLAVMETSLHLLEHTDDVMYRQQKIAQLRQQIVLVAKYIQDMLMVSQLEHVPTLTREPVDLKPLTASCIQSLSPAFEQKAIQCDVQYQDDPLIANVNAEQMCRVLTNLIENAIHYTPAGGQVHVTLLRQNDSVVVKIRDTGMGIQAEDIPHIFDTFFRATEAKKVVATGSGLGLAIVKRIVDLYGGTISVTSQPQQGSSFCLTLPAQDPVENHRSAVGR